MRDCAAERQLQKVGSGGRSSPLASRTTPSFSSSASHISLLPTGAGGGVLLALEWEGALYVTGVFLNHACQENTCPLFPPVTPAHLVIETL